MRPLPAGSFHAIPGKHYATPKELWGFRSERGRGTSRRIAWDFLEANRGLLGIESALDRLAFRQVLRGLGADHVIYQQRLRGRRIHRAYVTVHIGRDRRVYLVKSRAVPDDILRSTEEPRLKAARAIRLALAACRRASGSVRVVGVPELLWYPARRLLHPAWRVRIHRTKPRAELITYVHAITGRIIARVDNLAEATGRARVFLPNPMARDRTFEPLGPKDRVLRPPEAAYAPVALTDLTARGRLNGRRVTTRLTKDRIVRPSLDFTVANYQRGFEEVSAYYHVNEAIAYLERLGYRGPRRLFADPLRINARGTRDDNSWYSPGERTLTFGTGDVDDAEDGETVLHEFGHALQDAICRDFGQSQEAAAMGEGFGDYFAGSFFAARKPACYLDTVMSWDGVHLDGHPPGVRRLDSELTYESFDHGPHADEHDNGQIWSATLWDIWKALTRRVADRIIVDSHFQLDGFTTFARGARAILDADRHLFRGRHAATLRRIFRQRGIGPVE
ncbi:MAG TPA: M36 family metallopeptidase [Candidatus Bathyarchaeia archaeon]|nr:M36 family metallopeptidase [Candidatus Bathyarchaeia archaeon]